MEKEIYRIDQLLPEARVRTLVIEDSPLALRAMVNLLETDPVLDIVGTATDGETGLDLAQKQRPDLVIADLELPGMSGLAITETLRKQFPWMRLVVISVHDGFMWQNLSCMRGADAFLGKHRLHIELLVLIKRLFPRRSALVTAEGKSSIAK